MNSVMLDFLKTVPASATDGSPVLVLLHGRGSHMGDLQGLSRVLPPDGSLIRPQAPHSGAPWGYGPGWAWYRYMGEDRVESESLRNSLVALENLMAGLPDVVGFEPGSIVLGGFSQGGGDPHHPTHRGGDPGRQGYRLHRILIQ